MPAEGASPSEAKDEQQRQSYSEWVRSGYSAQYERWMPWLEDKYLAWFGKGDNKASYATKAQLDSTKITGSAQIDKLQDGVHGLVGGQLGRDGLLQPVGDAASKHGVDRVERGGKDEHGSYAGGPVLGRVVDPLVEGGKSAGGVLGGVVGAGRGK